MKKLLTACKKVVRSIFLPLCLYFSTVLESEPHIILGVDRHEIQQPTPERRLEFLHQGILCLEGFEVGFDGGLPGLFVLDCRLDHFQPRFSLIESSRQTVVAFLVFLLVESDMGVLIDGVLHQFRGHQQLCLQVIPLPHQSTRIKGGLQRKVELCDDGVLLRNQLIDRRHEKLFDLVLIEVWRGAFLITFKLVIALPDDPTVFVVGVSGLGAIPAAAVTAFNPAGEKVDTAMPPSAVLSLFQLTLHHLENIRLYDSLVVSLDIVLWNLALVDLFLFCEKVNSVAFLQEGIALVLLIREDAPNRTGVPFRLATRGKDALGSKPCGDSVGRHSLEEHSVDAADDNRLFLIQHKVPIRASVIAEETRKRNGDLTICEPLSLPPGAVLRN